MSISEFLYPIWKGSKKDVVITTLFYLQEIQGKNEADISEVRHLLELASYPKYSSINIADYFLKSIELVQKNGITNGKSTYRLTKTGVKYVKELLDYDSQEIEKVNTVETLEALISLLKDEELKNYLKEGLNCYRINALRACVVFLWVGTIYQIQLMMLAKNNGDLNDAMTKHYSNARDIHTIDDFAYIRESTQLLAAQDLGLFDKNERQILEQALTLRNKCGHPGRYKPGPKKVAAFIEDLVTVIYS